MDIATHNTATHNTAENNSDDASSIDSSDLSWTPDVESEEEMSDDEEDNVWKEDKFSPERIKIIFNQTDKKLEDNYFQEIIEIRRRIRTELEFIDGSKEGFWEPILDTNKLFNIFFPASIVYELMVLMNRHLLHHKKKQ